MSRLFDISWTERGFLLIFAFFGPCLYRWVADMPNYWIGATGHYYFPGLYTAILPMVPGIYAIARLLRHDARRGIDGAVRQSTVHEVRAAHA